MLSRIAETVYWLGRYLERAENTARLLQVNYLALTEAPVAAGARDLVAGPWHRLLAMTGDDSEFARRYAGAGEEAVVDWLAFQPENPASICSSMAGARNNARTVRYHLNVEMWEALNRAYNDVVVNHGIPPGLEALNEYCVAVREASHLFFGIADATLPRGECWCFLKAGQYLERADNVLRLLSVQFGDSHALPAEDRVLQDHRSRSFLRSVGAYEAFRHKDGQALEPDAIADFLLRDDAFPRSVRWSTARLHEALQAIAAQNPGTSPAAVRLSGWLASQLEYLLGVTQVIRQQRPGLEELLAAVAEIAEALEATYFVHPGPVLLGSIPQEQQ